MNRRHFLTFSVAAASGVMAGCQGYGPVTERLLKNPEYKETLKAFLITQDGKKLVVLGEHYHYIFDMSPQLRTVMTASFRSKLHTEFADFEAKGDKVSGRYMMHLNRDDIDRDNDFRKLALADGFEDEGSRLTESGTISGTRYLPSNLDGAQIPHAFNFAYDVTVTQKPTAFGKATRLVLSPVAAAADGGLMLLVIALIPIEIPLLIIMLNH